MERKQNFLDVLEQKLEEMKSDEIITEEQLREGISISETWLFSDSIKRKDIERTIVNILSSRSEKYASACKFKGKNPNKPGEIRIIKIGESLQIDFKGNDDWSKFVIRNKKDDRMKILQLSPNQFLDQIFSSIRDRQKKQIQEQTGMSDYDLSKIISNIYDMQSRNAFRNGLNDGLNEMSENLIEYYKYLLEEEKLNEEYITRQEEKKSIKEVQEPEELPRVETIQGGVIEIPPDSREYYESRGGTSKPRANEKIDFEERDEYFKSLNPIKIITYDAFTEENEIVQSHNVYVYDMIPNRDGCVMVCEPFLGTQSSRLIYLPTAILEDFLLADKKMDNQYWVEISQYYLEMSKNEFREEERTSILNHTSFENYKETMQQLIEGQRTGNKQKGISVASQMRATRVSKKLFDGEKAPDISRVVKGVVHEELAEIRGLLKQVSKQADSNSLEEKVPYAGEEEEEL